MRLKHIYISEYKNLKDFSLEFDGESFIDIFVGKNGTGKSNLFEALIEIFRLLFEDNYEVKFDFKLLYELEGKEIFVSWKWAEEKWLDQQEEEVKKINKSLLPDNILIYYSGHNDKITELVESYEDNFKKNLKEANEGDTREFIGIGKEYKALLLSVLLLQPDNCKAKKFIIDKLGIKSIDDQFKITLKRPFYSRQKGYDIDVVQAETRFWKAQGITLQFLDKLNSIKKGTIKEKGKVRDEGYIYRDDYKDEFILYLDIQDFQEKFTDASTHDVFRDLDNLKTIEMLDDISIELELLDGSKIDVDAFSDGQFQSVYIYSIIELFKDNNCIALLDEPDAFLHPEWQYDFLTQVFEITEKTSENINILMTSHSAVTLIPHKRDKIAFFDFKKDRTVHSFLLPKKVAIDKLSSKLISYSEQDQLLSIINTIQIENKPVLFTEGKTDPIIIKEAWNKLYPEKEIPFIPFYAFGHKYLVQLIQDPEIIKEMNGLPIFGLFDYDKAFNTWNGFSTEDIEIDINKGLIKKLPGHEVYAIMLPVPKDKPIQNQVINQETGKTYGEYSVMAIEHLFCHLEEISDKFTPDLSIPSKFLKFRGNKVTFAKDIVPNLKKEDFECLIPLFEFIEKKIEDLAPKEVEV